MKKRQVIDGKQECIGCHQWKPLDEFYVHKPSSTGRAWRCKECHKSTLYGGLTPSQRSRQWAKDNPERHAQLTIESRQRIIHDPARLQARRDATNRNYEKNRETCLKSHQNWLLNNPWALIADRARTLIRMTLIGMLNGGPKFLNLVGCDGNTFRSHIQSKWLPGMSWTNYGRSGWTIGHITPVAHFKSTLHTHEGLKACFHYSNLQPEWAHTNSAKFTRTTLTPAQQLLAEKRSPELASRVSRGVE